MICYARMNGGKDPNAIRKAFVSCGADSDEIIIDDSRERKKESEAYLKAKESAVTSRELTIDSLDSIGKTNREIAKELEWLSSNNINLRVMDLQATMEPGVQATDILRDVYARLAEEERERELGADNRYDIQYWAAYLDGARAQKKELTTFPSRKEGAE